MPVTIDQLVSDIQRAVGDLSRVVATMPTQRKLAIINSSTKFVLDPDLLEALQIQLTRDVYPAWNVNYKIETAASPEAVPADAYLKIVDQPSDPGALGFHDETGGRPTGEVSVDASAADGVPLSSVLSHEAVELSVDPLVDSLVLFRSSTGQWQLYFKEDGDPVQADSYQITVKSGKSFAMSNFVYPAYFTGDPGKWDHMGRLSGPLPAMSPGGYLSVLNITPDASGWGQLNGRTISTPIKGTIFRASEIVAKGDRS